MYIYFLLLSFKICFIEIRVGKFLNGKLRIYNILKFDSLHVVTINNVWLETLLDICSNQMHRT